MFERYTEKARRTVFYARFEAAQAGAAYISPVHMLLGLLRDDPDLFTPFLHEGATAETLRTELAAKQPKARKQVSASVDLPLSIEAKRCLAYGAEHSERLGQRHIGTIHLLLGVLREPSDVPSFVVDHGITFDGVLEYIRQAEPAEADIDKRAHRAIAFAGRAGRHTTMWFLPDGSELEITQSIEPDAAGDSVTCSLTIRAYGQERSFETKFDVP
jgi:ATP-dependent Clp protease ATP-binding subunit ClpC